MNKIFIIIPAYNEEQNIVKLLTDIKKLILPVKANVIIVDDGSADKTFILAESFKNQLPIQIIRHEKNLGVPKSFYDGFKAAASAAENSDLIFLIEGDNTSDLNLIPEMIKKIEAGADVVIASRYLKGGCYKNFPLKRVLGSYLINTVLKIFFPIKGVTDYSIFYRGYRGEPLKKALDKYGENFITTKSFASNLEVLLKVKENSVRFEEVPLIYDYGKKKGKSKMKLLKTLKEYQSLIFRRICGKL